MEAFNENIEAPELDDTLTGFEPGSTIAGKYVVEREIGAGGTGIVVGAIHMELGQRVAIKYLRAGKHARPQVLDRFKREARLAASLRSEHVVRIYDVGALDNGVPYMVMEYLDGEDLGAVLSRGPVSIEQAVGWTLEACETLAEAHSQGIIHRDLKPANLFLTTRSSGPPIVKVVDFGISKVSAASTGSYPSLRHMTGQHERFGTPFYMSPEQLISSANVDARSDIWSIGVVLYELLTGKLPFEGEDLRQLIANVLSGSPMPIRAHRELPAALEKVIMSCLQYEPGHRPASVAELAQKLEAFAVPDPSRRIVRPLEMQADLSGVHDVLAWVPPTGMMQAVEPSTPGGRALMAIVGAASVMLGAGLMVAFTTSRQHAPPVYVTATAPPAEVIMAAEPIVVRPPTLHRVAADAGSPPAKKSGLKRP